MEHEIKRLQKRNRILLTKLAGVSEMSYQVRNMPDITPIQMCNLLNAVCYTIDLPDEWWNLRERLDVNGLTYDAIQTYIAAKLVIIEDKR